MHLIAFAPLLAAFNPWVVLVWLEVALGLGMVIFIHELGHFLVAKACGVKCEKFYLGFDIYGLKLAKFKWGETEYGIGILPLGGYVKMLGQDDNPAKAAEERERSKLSSAAGGVTVPTDTTPVTLDPRSYMAKSVPQRMAIISAGVIMNVIFAYAMATWAYSIGVLDVACGISAVLPGEAAWKADLQPGDRILGINHSDQKQLRFRDLMSAVALANMQDGVDFLIRREGIEDPFWVNVRPDTHKGRLKPTIGVLPARTVTLADELPAMPGSPAAATDAFKGGDRILAVNQVPMHRYADIVRELARHPGETLKVLVARDGTEAAREEQKRNKQASTVEPEQVVVDLPPRPLLTLGLRMAMGPITAVQLHSPAYKADLRVGDQITSIDGEPVGDPLLLPEQLRRRAGQTVKLGITRAESPANLETLEKSVTPVEPSWYEQSAAEGSPLAITALGLTYSVGSTIVEVEPGSEAAAVRLAQGGKPAEKAEFAPGDEIAKAVFQTPKDDNPDDDGKPIELAFNADRPNWPYLMNLLQLLPAGTKVTLTLSDGRSATIEPRVLDGYYYADRGLVTQADLITAKATSLGEAISMAGHETKESVLQVYAFIRKIGSQISPYGLGGPKTIFLLAGEAAKSGLSQFLIFLTLLSANLAVLNFLPIPLLDGGHMVFLILEGILRRPVNEKVIVAFHYLGLVFIVSLMLFVLGLDFNIIPRPH